MFLKTSCGRKLTIFFSKLEQIYLRIWRFWYRMLTYAKKRSSFLKNKDHWKLGYHCKSSKITNLLHVKYCSKILQKFLFSVWKWHLIHIQYSALLQNINTYKITHWLPLQNLNKTSSAIFSFNPSTPSSFYFLDHSPSSIL